MECVHAGDERWRVFTQAEGMWSVHAGDDRWSVFTQVEGVWSVHAGGRDVECGNFLLESTFSADSYGVRTVSYTHLTLPTRSLV